MGGDAVTGEDKKALGAIDIQRILELLPHRYPFLLVDRIIELDRDQSCIGIKNVTVNEPQFMGHFPGRPLFPGVLMIEAMAQTAGALVMTGYFNGDGEGKQVLAFGMRVQKIAQGEIGIRFGLPYCHQDREVHGPLEPTSDVEGFVIEDNGFSVGERLQRLLGAPEQVTEGMWPVLRTRKMMPENLVLFGEAIRIECLDG